MSVLQHTHLNMNICFMNCTLCYSAVFVHFCVQYIVYSTIMQWFLRLALNWSSVFGQPFLWICCSSNMMTCLSSKASSQKADGGMCRKVLQGACSCRVAQNGPRSGNESFLACLPSRGPVVPGVSLRQVSWNQLVTTDIAHHRPATSFDTSVFISFYFES